MTEPSGKDEGIESQIKAAILSRLSYFQNQADSLTFEGVRRLVEKDLGLETHALDSHKRFVKQWLQKCIESASDDKLTKSEGTVEETALSSTEEEAVNKAEGKKDSAKLNSGGGEIMEDSPVMGLLSGPKKVKGTTNGAEEAKTEAAPSEAKIKEAVWERASYLKENSQSVTLAGLRRLLEEDLELEKHSLDPFKKFISLQVDDVLAEPESPLKTLVDKKKTAKKDSKGKVPAKSRKEKEPTTSGDESDDVSEEDVKPKRKTAPSTKMQKTPVVKKRKRPEEDSKGAKTKQSKASNSISDASGDEDGGDGGDVSENENSESSAEKPVKKKEAPKPPSYGKQVEHLKSVIKSCGMSIPPVVYKKVKQAPENKRESCLIKELEEILSKEGLSSNPSEKDIKEVKKRKDRTKELEGIDMSNIVVSSRRRSAISFAPPPKPKIPDLSESESEESEDNSEDDDDEVEIDEEAEDEEGEGEAEGDDQEDAGAGSASDESDKADGDSE